MFEKAFEIVIEPPFEVRDVVLLTKRSQFVTYPS